MATSEKPISEVLAEIRESMNLARNAFERYSTASYNQNTSDEMEYQKGLVGFFLDRAFMQLRLFLEANSLSLMLAAVTAVVLQLSNCA